MAASSGSAAPRISARPLRDDGDFWRVRELLVETYPLMPPDFNWDVRRWDGARFYNRVDALADPEWRRNMRVWEAEDGRLVGLAHDDGPGDAYLEVHPAYRSLIEEEMLAWSEGNLATTAGNGQRRVDFYVFEYDLRRRLLLERRGYEKLPDGGTIRRVRLANRAFAEPAMPAGYTLRTTRPDDWDDYGRMADLLNAAFRRTIHSADEYDTFVRGAPSFRLDLNLVAEAGDGSFAAHAAVNYDERNRRGIFEPVCTHPAHRRLGLARGLMAEGLRRLGVLGAAEATVATWNTLDSNHLYETLIGDEVYHAYVWRKRWA